MNRIRGLSALFLVIFTLAVAFLWWRPYFHNVGGGFDESMLLVYPELILDGRLPYRDFSTFYAPGNIFVLAGFYKFLGISLTSERIVGFVYRCLYLFALGWLGRKLAPWLSWLFVIVGVVTISFLRLDAFAWIPACTLGLLSVLLGCADTESAARRKYLPILAGLTAGLALLFRQDLVPALALGILPILFAWTWEERRKWIISAVAGFLPLGLLAFKTSVQAIWLNLFYFPVIQSSPGRKIPFFTLEPARQQLVGLVLLLMLANLATATWFFYRNRRDLSSRLYLAAALFAAGTSHQLVQRFDLGHIAMGAMITLPLFIATLSFWLRGLSEKPAWGVPFLTALFAGLFLVQPASEYSTVLIANLPYLTGGKHFEIFPVSSGHRSFPLQNLPSQKGFTAVVDFLNQHSLPGQTVYVAQGDLRCAYVNDIFLYHLLLPRLRPAAYHIESEPLVTNAANSGVDRQLLTCDWVVLNEIWDKINEPNRSQEIGYEGPVRVLEAQFALVKRVGPLRVYRNHRLPPLTQ